MTELEKGYVAGIIDGEGTVTLTRIHSTDKFRAPSIEVTSTTYEILDKLKTLYGGNISNVTKREEHHKQAYRWVLRYDKALFLLKDVFDYLLEPNKKARAKLLLEKYKEVTPRNGKYNSEKLEEKLNFEKMFFEL